MVVYYLKPFVKVLLVSALVLQAQAEQELYPYPKSGGKVQIYCHGNGGYLRVYSGGGNRNPTSDKLDVDCNGQRGDNDTWFRAHEYLPPLPPRKKIHYSSYDSVDSGCADTEREEYMDEIDGCSCTDEIDGCSCMDENDGCSCTDEIDGCSCMCEPVSNSTNMYQLGITGGKLSNIGGITDDDIYMLVYENKTLTAKKTYCNQKSVLPWPQDGSKFNISYDGKNNVLIISINNSGCERLFTDNRGHISFHPNPTLKNEMKPEDYERFFRDRGQEYRFVYHGDMDYNRYQRGKTPTSCQ